MLEFRVCGFGEETLEALKKALNKNGKKYIILKKEDGEIQACTINFDFADFVKRATRKLVKENGGKVAIVSLIDDELKYFYGDYIKNNTSATYQEIEQYIVPYNIFEKYSKLPGHIVRLLTYEEHLKALEMEMEMRAYHDEKRY